MSLNPFAKIALGAALSAVAPCAFATEADRTYPASGGILAAPAAGTPMLAPPDRSERFGLSVDAPTTVSLAPSPMPLVTNAPAVVVTATPTRPQPLVGLEGMGMDGDGLARDWALGPARTDGAHFEDEWSDPFRGYVSPTSTTGTLRERRSKRLQPGQSRWQWKALSTIQYTMSDALAFKAGYKPMGSEGKMPFVAVVWRY